MPKTEEAELTLEKWLNSTEAKRELLLKYSRSPLTRDIGERMDDMEKAIQYSSDAANLLADAEAFLVHEQAKSMFDVLAQYENFTSKQQEILIKDKIRLIQRVVDGLKVMNRAIHDRIYANLNANRAR